MFKEIKRDCKNKRIKPEGFKSKYEGYKLPDSFIEQYQDRVNWSEVFRVQELPKLFKKKCKYGFDWKWYWISKEKKLSEKFIIKHLDKIVLSGLCENEKIKLSPAIKLKLILMYPEAKEEILKIPEK